MDQWRETTEIVLSVFIFMKPRIDWSVLAVTPEEIQEHMKELLAQANMRIFVLGNMFKDVSNIFSI